MYGGSQSCRRRYPRRYLAEAAYILRGKSTHPPPLNDPLVVSDMSVGSLSEEAKVALATGAELAGTGICSGEGGMLAEEQAANSRYFYELASARFGYDEKLLTRVQAFHFKGGQAAKTGTGGHLPANKVAGQIAEVRGLPHGHPAASPSTSAALATVAPRLLSSARGAYDVDHDERRSQDVTRVEKLHRHARNSLEGFVVRPTTHLPDRSVDIVLVVRLLELLP